MLQWKWVRRYLFKLVVLFSIATIFCLVLFLLMHFLYKWKAQNNITIGQDFVLNVPLFPLKSEPIESKSNQLMEIRISTLLIISQGWRKEFISLAKWALWQWSPQLDKYPSNHICIVGKRPWSCKSHAM